MRITDIRCHCLETIYVFPIFTAILFGKSPWGFKESAAWNL